MLLTLGVSHKTAPLAIREKFAFSSDSICDALHSLSHKLALEELTVLSTCNRTEFYCATDHLPQSFPQHLSNWWQSFCQTKLDVKPYLYLLPEEKMVQHLMRVASGLDSMVMGEPQILGQLKNAFILATNFGVAGKKLSRLFQMSFRTAKKIRTHTAIAAYPVSVAYAAVRLAKQIFSDLSQTTVVLIGAGENIELTLPYLHQSHVKRLIIVNRTLAHAQKLTERYGGEARGLEDLSAALSVADIVISSINCQSPVVTGSGIFGAKRRPVLMVDLGVPRNIDPNLAQSEDIYLYTIDDLNGIVTDNLKSRQRAALEAESIILKASADYMHWLASQQQVKTICQLRTKAHSIKENALQEALKKIEKGSEPKIVMAEFAHQLTQKLLHQPTVRLRKHSPEKLELAKELFDLE